MVELLRSMWWLVYAHEHPYLTMHPDTGVWPAWLPAGGRPAGVWLLHQRAVPGGRGLGPRTVMPQEVRRHTHNKTLL